MSALAALWGRELSALSRVARRIEDRRRRREPAFARRLEEINNTITQA